MKRVVLKLEIVDDDEAHINETRSITIDGVVITEKPDQIYQMYRAALFGIGYTYDQVNEYLPEC